MFVCLFVYCSVIWHHLQACAGQGGAKESFVSFFSLCTVHLTARVLAVTPDNMFTNLGPSGCARSGLNSRCGCQRRARVPRMYLVQISLPIQCAREHSPKCPYHGLNERGLYPSTTQKLTHAVHQAQTVSRFEDLNLKAAQGRNSSFGSLSSVVLPASAYADCPPGRDRPTRHVTSHATVTLDLRIRSSISSCVWHPPASAATSSRHHAGRREGCPASNRFAMPLFEATCRPFYRFSPLLHPLVPPRSSSSPRSCPLTSPHDPQHPPTRLPYSALPGSPPLTPMSSQNPVRANHTLLRNPWCLTSYSLTDQEKARHRRRRCVL